MKLLISAILLAASTGAINVSVSQNSQKQGRIVIVPSKESEILSDLFLTRHKLDLLEIFGVLSIKETVSRAALVNNIFKFYI